MEWSQFFKSEVWIPLSSFLILLLADTILGILVAIKNKTFTWEFLGKWVEKTGMQGLGLVVLGALAAMKPEVYIAFYPAVATADATLIASIVNKIKDFVTVVEPIVVAEPIIVEPIIVPVEPTEPIIVPVEPIVTEPIIAKKVLAKKPSKKLPVKMVTKKK